MLPTDLAALVSSSGAWIVGALVGLESMGLPVPGETVLIAAAVYAGTTGRLSIVSAVVAAAVGAIAGDNVGFTIGRHIGYGWLVRHGSVIHMTPRRLKLGQYLFLRHGGAVVFLGRFVAVLRALAAFLAGVNCMRWRRFLLFNAAGGVVWASIYGLGAYYFGQTITRFARPVGLVLVILTVALVLAAFAFVRRHEQRLEDEAERQLPGPLRR